jgi:crotonobetainyl-CoA:carnitine CoA-transferase CaiB-like acyl-CoA transferase
MSQDTGHDGGEGADRSSGQDGPLHGIRVVELGVWVAGPATGGILADWGASVIKVEPPAGDPQRRVFGALGVADQAAVPPFEIDNRGKRSVVLDLRAAEGREVMERLLATADVFVTNLRPDALERLGLDHAAVLARHPRLVYGSITGYGLDGPDRDRAGYDMGAFWARSGLAHTLVPPGEMPPPLRSGMGDHVTGISLAAGVLAKLVERGRTGRGGLAATSLLRAGTYTVGWDMGIQLRFGKRESTRSRAENRAPLMSCYRASDGRAFWLLALEADRHWPGIVAAIDDPVLRDDERFLDARSRLTHCAELIAVLDGAFARRPYHEWTERFDAHDVWWAPLNSLVDAIADPQVQASGAFVDMTPHEGEEPYRAVATPVDFDDRVLRPGPVPRLGEHTAEVRAAFDVGAADPWG